jgi:3-carboxy-cis,cis-muconate cycloisomerase
MTVSPLDSEVYGNLFGTPQMRALFSDATRFQRMLDVEAALARAQGRLGVIPPEAAQTIAAKANAGILDTERMRAKTEVVGLPVVPLVTALVEACGEEAGRYVHWGATTQDIIDTGLVLQMRDAFALLDADLGRAILATAGLADRYRSAVMAGRTHLQHAVPITFGFKAAVWLASLLDLRQRLATLGDQVLVAQYSGAAGTLSAVADRGIAIADALAEDLGLGTPDISWHVRRGGIAETGCFLGVLCGALGKIAKDVILLAQTEVGEAAEPHVSGRGGSSTMPQKRNPIMSEYVLASARNVHALVPVLLGGMIQDHERATDSWQAEWVALPQMFVMTAGALNHAAAILEGLVVDPARMRSNLAMTDGLIMAEAVQTALRPVLGHDRAHHAVEAACKRAMAERISLKDALTAVPEISAAISAEEIAAILDPANYTGCANDFIDRVLARLIPD